MRTVFSALTLLVARLPLPALSAAPTPAEAARIREDALKDDLAWDIAEGLTTEVGQRLAATEAEERARVWAVARLKALGFSKVRVEPFTMTRWTRGAERASIVAPFPQSLAVAALGGSSSTPPGGITAEVVAYPSLAAFQAADPAEAKGKIVFVSHAMTVTSDMNGYGTFSAVRREAPKLAAQRGAVAVLIRSVGTDYHRNPHTGAGAAGTGIAAGALALPDAEQLMRAVKRGKPVRMNLVLESRSEADMPSGNVIAEIPGSDPAAGTIVIGGHLDSWDLGTGAVDDAAGLAITTAAAKRIMAMGKPLRTIRLVWFGAEEPGLVGAAAYAKAHAGEKVAFAAESDAGAGRVLSFETSIREEALPAMQPLRQALVELGVTKGHGNGAAEGSDISVLARQGAPIIGLAQDMTRYFDLHHTPDDTLDKIDLGELRQNVAAWTLMLAFLANDRTELGPVAVSDK
ncbi:M28 family peptidase [Novosphingobium sp. JCM 18896]|uniref:M28 family peptidase n=1 Tax=Novosphingobium sp. JCM 18896 TaxID=2989731 RepID=UPI002222908D|nr:M28 family peptidase [Novosphingobium sp. JCM 18896]MCW1427648.1 M20/M25/M40 family metallo-hydrolase [Novosphingobium sp. JCM 18896]